MLGLNIRVAHLPSGLVQDVVVKVFVRTVEITGAT